MRAVALYAVLAAVTDLPHATVHLDEECVRCIIVEQGDTSEPSAMPAHAFVADSQTVETRAGRTWAWSRTPHQPRAPPTLS